MKRSLATLAFTLLAGVSVVGAAAAQNVVVSNARIIVGNGEVIDKGSVVVRDGKIVSVAAGPAPASAIGKGASRIDATGMTVMPGFIDDHRHLIYGPPDRYFKEQEADRMRELLEAGFTTVQSGGDPDAAVLQLRADTASGKVKGPRILASGRAPTNRFQNEEETRAAVRKVIATGVDSVAEVIFPEHAFPAVASDQERKNLAAGIDEANKLHTPFQVHAVSPPAMLDAVALGAKKLVHTPHFGWLTDADAQAVKAAGAQVSSCVGFGAPVFDVFNHDNKPTFRDGRPWPQGILDGQGRGREAGFKPVNGRTLWDNGVTYGFCTDTTYNATAALSQELRVLNLTFSPLDLVTIMGPNSAAFIDKQAELGTLEPGKLGDIVVLTGNPLDGYWNYLTAVVTIKGGVVMIDKRAQLKTVRVLRP